MSEVDKLINLNIFEQLLDNFSFTGFRIIRFISKVFNRQSRIDKLINLNIFEQLLDNFSFTGFRIIRFISKVFNR